MEVTDTSHLNPQNQVGINFLLAVEKKLNDQAILFNSNLVTFFNTGLPTQFAFGALFTNIDIRALNWTGSTHDSAIGMLDQIDYRMKLAFDSYAECFKQIKNLYPTVQL